MPRHIVSLLVSGLGLLLVLPIRVSAAGMPQTVEQHKTVAGYVLLLQIGPAESMSSGMKGMKGMNGEHMLGGKMAACTMSGDKGMNMSMGKCNRHVELHITDAKTHKVVTKAHVSIQMVDTAKHMTVNVPIAMMQGMGASMHDYHYGNNVHVATGMYRVKVKVNKVRTAFTVHLM